jgi:RNA polymerase sigma-70 factor (ECF subfamily)
MVTTAAADADDRAVIARIAIGDRSAFETFYHAYIRRAHAFAYALTASPDLADEIASDTMVEVWKSAQRYRGRASVSTWVLAIAHHRTIDALRR